MSINKNELTLAIKLRQSSVIDKIKSINWNKGSNSPWVVDSNPTTACDLACPGCISGDLLNQNHFSSARLLELGQELIEAGVRAVVLIGGGEPLIHPAIGKFIELLGENDVHIGITTNGTFIDKHMEVIAKYSSWTRVSVDAASEEISDKLRPARNGKSKFVKVIANMRELAKHKKGKLGYSFLIRTEADGDAISETNIFEIYAAAKLAKEIGCDYFEVKPSYSMDHFLITHDEELMNKAQEEIERLFDLEDEHFKILKSVNLDFILHNEHNIQPKDYHACPVAELRTLITPSGVYVCPYFRGRKDKSIGELHESSFKQMWHGEQRREVMGKLDPQRDCQMHCIRHDSNLELFRMQNYPDQIDFIEDFNYFI